MADFMGITSCNGAKIPVNKRVGLSEYIRQFNFGGGDLTVGLDVGDTFHFYGYEWPYIRLIEDEDNGIDSTDEFFEGLKQFVGKQPIKIQMIGYEKCRWPLSAMEVVITKKKVTYNGFKN